MKIIQLPNKKLRKVSQKVPLPLNEEDEKIVQMMIKYIDDSQKKDSKLRTGIGIAAIQMGFLKRMFYINVPLNKNKQNFRDFLINPKIISESLSSAALAEGEGCLSVNEKDDKKGYVHRKFKIVVSGYSYFQKQIVEYQPVGLLAIVFQHEMDHLNGKLYLDSINNENPWTPLKNEEIIE